MLKIALTTWMVELQRGSFFGQADWLLSLDLQARIPTSHSGACNSMSQLQLKKISKEIIERAEQSLVPEHKLPKMVDDYFVQRLKQDEMHHAEVDARLYE